MAKNGYRSGDDNVSDTNKLRYVLMGDPAMRLAVPWHRVVVDEIGGREVEDLDTAEDPATLMARQQTTIKGRIVDASGALLSDFNGTVEGTLYDAMRSVTTLGRGGEDGKEVTFDQAGGACCLLVAQK